MMRPGQNNATEYNDDNVFDTLVDLGEQGWELVSISSRAGQASFPEERYDVDNDVQYVASDISGFTGEELWVFKRPKG